MQRMMLVLAALAVGAGMVLAQGRERAKVEFRPVEAVSTVDAVYPPNSIGQGTVMLEVTVGADGEVEDVKVLRDVPSLTVEAQRAAKQWRFRPATLNGKPVRATTHVGFNFRTYGCHLP